MTSRGRVLLVSPAFFGYESALCRAFEAEGFDVRYVDERPGNSAVVRALLRVSGRLGRFLTRPYFDAHLRRLSVERFDLVLVIKGEVVPPSFLEGMRQLNPTARFIYYSYDRIEPGSAALDLFDHMDSLYSFDPRDVARYSRFIHKPLFYSEEFHPPAEEPPARRHPLAFVGTLHSDRYNFVRQLATGSDAALLFFYVPARWFFAVGKYITGQFRDVAWHDVSFSKMSKAEVASVFRNSVAVIDLQRTGQRGLTMRTFEVLASGALLVTANAAIRETELYDPAHVLVIDDYRSPAQRERLRVRLESQAAPGVPAGFDRYSLRNWVGEFIREVELPGSRD